MENSVISSIVYLCIIQTPRWSFEIMIFSLLLLER